MLNFTKKQLNFQNFSKYRPQLIPLLLIVLLAAFLRLYRIDVLMRFIWDEGRDMSAIRNIIVNQDLTLMGPFNEIGGKTDFFGVFHYYLMLPALWLANFNPVGPAIFTAMLGVATVFCSYIWLKKWLKPNLALAMTALLAVSPLAVKYTQWPWNPNTTGFFAILLLLSLQKWQTKPKYWLACLSGLLLGLLFQLHYFTIALGLPILLTILWQKKLSWRKKFLHSALAGFFCFLPNLSFVIFDLTHEGFYRKHLVASFSSSGQNNYFIFQPWTIFTQAPLYIFDVASKFFAHKILGAAASLGFFFWLIQSLKTGFKQKKALPSFKLATAWTGFLLIVTLFPDVKNDYHSAALWLALPLSLITQTKFIWNKIKPFFRFILLTFLIIFLIWQNKFWRVPDWSQNMPLVREASLIIAQDVKQQQLDHKFNVASFVDSDTRATRFRYFIEVENLQAMHHDRYPESHVLYVITPHTWEETKKNPAWELETFREQEANLLGEKQNWKVYQIMNQ